MGTRADIGQGIGTCIYSQGGGRGPTPRPHPAPLTSLSLTPPPLDQKRKRRGYQNVILSNRYKLCRKFTIIFYSLQCLN